MPSLDQITGQGPAAVIVQQGRVLDFIDGLTQRRETPEEYVRQEIAKSLVREYTFSKAQISVEFQLRLGARKPRADLVIFDQDASHRQEDVRIIVECKSQRVKANDREEGVGQLHSYMSACPNALYGMWTNGLERFCYKRVHNGGRVSFDEIPDIPGAGRSEAEVERPRFDQLKAASSDALLFAFRRCHNYIAGNQGLQKPEAFWELLKLIFCKIFDERSSDEVDFYATSAERHGLNGQLRAVARIERLFDSVKSDYPAIFKENEKIELNPSVLAYIVTQLQSYSLLESDIDVKGRAYEEIVGSNLRGHRGEFFTPRNVCQMAINMLDPDERKLILDQVDSDVGTPFLAATQMFDLRPVPRKWLSLKRTDDSAGRFVPTGMILVTCSGDVGRATIAGLGTGKYLISHDLLRVEAIDAKQRGWIYAFLRSTACRDIMKAAEYGHMIKHLEVGHLDSLPFVIENDIEALRKYNSELQKIEDLREGAIRKTSEAEKLFSDQFDTVAASSNSGFSLRASEAFASGRRRFDAWYHAPQVRNIVAALSGGCTEMMGLSQCGADVWLPNRFKRIEAEDGLALVDSSSIFEINPDLKRKISASEVVDRYNGQVKKNCIMMSRSGQVYGLLGSVALATDAHTGKIVSDDVIRIEICGEEEAAGYIFTVLSHSLLGRPRVKALAYGSSIPHIEPDDLKLFPIPRLDSRLEKRIGKLALEAANSWAEADKREVALADEADGKIRKFCQ